MRILLDSHVFVWAKCAPENLSHDARATLIDPANDVFVSVASAWELWIKHVRKRRANPVSNCSISRSITLPPRPLYHPSIVIHSTG